MNKTLKTILFVFCGLLAVSLAVYLLFFRRTVEKNDPTTLGNTAGNLMNSGLFCEYNGDVYFSNSYDNGALYVLSGKDGSLKQLNSNNCYSINIAGKHLYYCMLSSGNNGKGLGSVVKNSGVYRTTLEGKATVCLNTSASIAMQLYGNELYYQQTTSTGTITVKQALDKSHKETIADFLMNPVSIDSGTIYYHGTAEDHYLYGMDTISGNTTVLWPENIWNPIYHKGFIYYLSMDGKYNLCRHALGSDTVEVLTTDRVDCFNVYGDIIFYSVSAGKNPALKRMHLDGAANEQVMEGVFHNINVTEEFAYFTPYDSPTPIYRQSTYGNVFVTEFTEARDAALKNQVAPENE